MRKHSARSGKKSTSFIMVFLLAWLSKDEVYDFTVMIQNRSYKGGDDYLPHHGTGAGVDVSSGGSLSDKHECTRCEERVEIRL